MAKTFDQLSKRVMSSQARRRAADRARELLAELALSEIRKMTGKSQYELARVLGIKQPSLSKLENQGDMQISTLRKLIHALGGEVRIIAQFGGREVRLAQFDGRTGTGRRVA